MITSEDKVFNKRRRKQSSSSLCCSSEIWIGALVCGILSLWLLGSVQWLSTIVQRPQRHGLLSDGITVTASVRGNLGPPSVILSDGQDWIKDRWQAASDMHGTAIKGSQWVELSFDRQIQVTKVVLDWEAAFSKDYRLESKNNSDENEWTVLYDGGDPLQESKRSVEEFGQSPGVKTKTPLHVVHTIYPLKGEPFQVLRIYIRKPAHGWGVSLWKVNVYGMDV
jgi:hypothetical protein